MKKEIKLLVPLFILIIILCGCTANNSIMNYNSDDYVNLYDYKKISMDCDYIQINDEDVQSIITTELSVHEAYVPVTNRKNVKNDDILLISTNEYEEYYIVGSAGISKTFDKNIIGKTIGNNLKISINKNETMSLDIIGIFRNATIKDRDFILEYYGYTDFNELERFIKERASNEIIFNFAYDKICENTQITGYPSEIVEQIEKDIDDAKNEILKKYNSINEFLKEQDISYIDFENEISSFYNDCMIYKAILDSEGICVTSKEIDEYNNQDNLNCYEIYRLIAEEKVRNIIVSNIVIE